MKSSIKEKRRKKNASESMATANITTFGWWWAVIVRSSREGHKGFHGDLGNDGYVISMYKLCNVFIINQ